MKERNDENAGEQESLKDREYRDKNGEIHHHTTTYEEQHRGEETRNRGEENEGKR